MKKTTPRRAFLQRSLLATAGLGLLSTQTIQAITASSPIEGYNPFAEEKTDLRIHSFGKYVSIKGVIYDKTGKMPLKNALVEVWHLSPGSSKYNHRGKMFTNALGEYEFISDFPNKKPSVDNTIHFKVSQGGSKQFTSLVLGHKDAYITSDHWQRNNQLGTKLFPTSATFLNKTTIQFNISI